MQGFGNGSNNTSFVRLKVRIIMYLSQMCDLILACGESSLHSSATKIFLPWRGGEVSYMIIGGKQGVGKFYVKS